MNHGVYFYEDDTFLIDNVAGFAKEGLERQETVIIVATEQHRSDLRNQTHRGSTRPVGRNISQLCDPRRLIDIRSIHAERLAGRGVVLKSHRSNYSIRSGQQAHMRLWRNGRGPLGRRERSRCDTSRKTVE